MYHRFQFHGHVQGVGFRYTTRRIARHFPVTGYVKNLPDGTVELVAGGESADVEQFVAAIQERFEGHITETKPGPHDTSEQYPGFEIRR